MHFAGLAIQVELGIVAKAHAGSDEQHTQVVLVFADYFGAIIGGDGILDSLHCRLLIFFEWPWFNQGLRYAALGRHTIGVTAQWRQLPGVMAEFRHLAVLPVDEAECSGCESNQYDDDEDKDFHWTLPWVYLVHKAIRESH